MKDNDSRMIELLRSAAPELLMLKEMMEENRIPMQDMMRVIYLASNIKKLSQWGRVIVTIKKGEIVAVSQEQQFISEVELNRSKK